MVTDVFKSHVGSSLRIILFLMVSITLFVDIAQAGGGPRDVVVVINSRSDVSRDIGRYYQLARGIPECNICTISCPDQEFVSEDICERQIREPVRRFVNQPNMAGKVDYIVLTKGVPLAADYGDTSGSYSVTGILTCLDRPEIMSPISFPYGPTAKKTWLFDAPEVAWSHSLDFNGYHFFLVTRLDAFTVDQVKSMINRGLHPSTNGLFVLDRNFQTIGVYRLANDRLGQITDSAYTLLTAKGEEVLFEKGQGFLSHLTNVMGHFSWSRHDEGYAFQDYISNSYLPGSVGDTYYSFSGRTFNKPTAAVHEPLIADLFSQGLCGAGGYVSEPQVTTATYPNKLFDRYTKGYNMAESFYAGCTNVFWKTVIVGDPLMSPYATPPQVSIEVPITSLVGIVPVTANVSDESGISKVVFYLDDIKLKEVTAAPYTIDLITTDFPIGPHTLEAIAYENTPVMTQGSAKLQVSIDNSVSAVNAIGDALSYPDGQYVRLSEKVVTAGIEDMGDSFFVEDNNRASAVRVYNTNSVNRGDIVTVTGSVETIEGERVILNAIVSVNQTGADVPKPLMMKLADLCGAGISGSSAIKGIGLGANNVSLLVKVAGNIVAASNGEFYINDGSAKTPIKVVCPGVSALPIDNYVAVIGISMVYFDGIYYRPMVRARDANDIQIIRLDGITQ